MLKRVLVYFENDIDAEYLIDYAKGFGQKFDVDIHGLYIKDLRKYEVVPPMVEGLVVDSASTYVMKEWDELEKKRIINIKEKFRKEFPANRFFQEEGITSDIILEKMKSYDLLLIARGEMISGNLKILLKVHTKPLIAVPKLEKYGYELPVIADDKGIGANESLFRFINLFDGIKEYTSLSLNMDKEDDYEMKEYAESIGINIDFIYEEGDSKKIFQEEAKKFDIVIMGNLRYNFMLEKITGKAGVKILESFKLPIFIA